MHNLCNLTKSLLFIYHAFFLPFGVEIEGYKAITLHSHNLFTLSTATGQVAADKKTLLNSEKG